jgi:hypothetical protein
MLNVVAPQCLLEKNTLPSLALTRVTKYCNFDIRSQVKFWILKNYLSPSLKEFLPEYSRRYGFDYEYVQVPTL